MAEDAGGSFRIIDTAPADHTYTGGHLCNLADPTSDLSPDYLCGELTWDGALTTLNWYHWNGSGWTRTILSDARGIAVGMDTADLTGNGRADLVAVEWPLGERAGAEDGRVFWFEQPADPFGDPWRRHTLAAGWSKAHDLHVGDITGSGRSDVLVRLKDGRISWFSASGDVRAPWLEHPVAETHPGDGTALYDVTGTGCLDVVTGSGFFENADGRGTAWRFRPFQAARDLQLDPETRVVAGDLVGDGSVTVVIAESEVLTNARLVLLHSHDRGDSWEAHSLIGRERDLGALHSLQLLDANADGLADIFTAEMELYREDTGIHREPTWKLFGNQGGLRFEEHTVLDANLGAHQGYGGRISSPDCTDFIAKNWHANSGNAHGGLNHIVHVRGPMTWQ